MKQLIILSLVVLSLYTTGCQMNGENANTPDGAEGQQVNDPAGELISFNARADHLAELSTDVPEVQRATAVVFGPYAVVGIDVDGSLDQSHVGTIKYQVAEALADDPHGANAAVTADPDILQRLEEMRREMADGRPLEAIADETAAIFGRLMPLVPTEEHRSDDPLDPPDEQSPESEEELEDIQRRQTQEPDDSH